MLWANSKNQHAIQRAQKLITTSVSCLNLIKGLYKGHLEKLNHVFGSMTTRKIEKKLLWKSNFIYFVICSYICLLVCTCVSLFLTSNQMKKYRYLKFGDGCNFNFTHLYPSHQYEKNLPKYFPPFPRPDLPHCETGAA